jgi:phosphate transport system substrate-binding protein
MRRCKLVFIFGLILVLAACSSGCEKKTQTKTSKKEDIKVSGSGTCLPLIELLAKEYSKKNPQVNFIFEPGVHSSGGIKGVADGILDIGTVSRDLKEEEKKLGLDYFLLSNDGLAVGVAKDVNLNKITTGQLKAVYQGDIVNWKDINGYDRAISVLDRNEDESAKIILRKFVLGLDLKVSKKATVLYFESEMIEAIKTAKGSIGYFSLGYALSTGLDVNLLEIDGIRPTVENILNGKYKIIRPLGIVVKKPRKTVQDFIDYMQSDEAKDVMQKRGFAPAG